MKKFGYITLNIKINQKYLYHLCHLIFVVIKEITRILTTSTCLIITFAIIIMSVTSLNIITDINIFYYSTNTHEHWSFKTSSIILLVVAAPIIRFLREIMKPSTIPTFSYIDIHHSLMKILTRPLLTTRV